MPLSIPFDPKQWRSMTVKQRYQLIEQILIRHKRFNSLAEEIDYCGFFANELPTSNPPCIVILGETGAGKTTLIKTWIASTGITRQETPEGSIIPYLYVSVPAQATIKALASVILETLGDPNAGRGTQWNMVGRLKLLIKECKVRMIFVDEFQHIVDKDTQHVLHAVADFLKDLINQTSIPMVLIGRIGEAERILTVNPQLDRRVGSPLILEPFAWDRQRDASTILEFRALMEHIDQALPFDSSGLGEEDMAYRFFYATNGYLGHIMEIIWHATRDAIRAECAILNLTSLAAAYDARIAGTAMGIGKVNPFTAAFTEASVPKVIAAPERQQLPARSGDRANALAQELDARRGETGASGTPDQRHAWVPCLHSLSLTPYPWESLSSLLCRAARRHHISHPEDLLHPAFTSLHLTESFLELPLSQGHLALLASLFHLDEETISRLSLHRFASIADPPKAIPLLWHNLVPCLSFFAHRYMNNTALCPLCLAEDAESYDRVYWKICGVLTCPQHRIRLVGPSPGLTTMTASCP